MLVYFFYCFYSSTSIKQQEEDLVEESIVDPLVMRSHGTSMVTSLLFVRVVSVGGERGYNLNVYCCRLDPVNTIESQQDSAVSFTLRMLLKWNMSNKRRPIQKRTMKTTMEREKTLYISFYHLF